MMEEIYWFSICLQFVLSSLVLTFFTDSSCVHLSPTYDGWMILSRLELPPYKEPQCWGPWNKPNIGEACRNGEHGCFCALLLRLAELLRRLLAARIVWLVTGALWWCQGRPFIAEWRGSLRRLGWKFVCVLLYVCYVYFYFGASCR